MSKSIKVVFVIVVVAVVVIVFLKNIWSNIFFVQKNLCPKNCGPKSVGSKKYVGSKKVRSLLLLVLSSFLAYSVAGSAKGREVSTSI